MEKKKTFKNIFKISTVLVFFIATLIFVGVFSLGCGFSVGDKSDCLIKNVGVLMLFVSVVFGSGVIVQIFRGKDYFISKRLTQIYFIVFGLLFVIVCLMFIDYLTYESTVPPVPLLI